MDNAIKDVLRCSRYTKGGIAYPAALTHANTVTCDLLSDVTVNTCFDLYQLFFCLVDESMEIRFHHN